MATLRARLSPARLQFDPQRFVQEQILRSRWQLLWLIVLVIFTLTFVRGRLDTAPVTTAVLLGAWAVSVALTAANELRKQHSVYTLWLKNNLYSSIANALITLILGLAIVAALFGLFDYAVANASISPVPPTRIRADFVRASAGEACFAIGGVNPDTGMQNIQSPESQCFALANLTEPLADGVAIGQTAANFCFDTIPGDPDNGLFCFKSTAENPGFFEVTRSFSGANWGAIWAGMPNLMLGRFDRSQMWRIQAVVGSLILLAVASFFVYRDSFQNQRVRRILTGLWLATPIVYYLLLTGVRPTAFKLESFLAVGAFAILFLLNRYASAPLLQRQKSLSASGQSGAAYLGGDLGLTLLRFAILVGLVITGIWAIAGAVNILFATLSLIQSGGQPALFYLDPKVNWGGAVLTIIISVFAIVVSFPLGLVLALGRRSTIPGIPGWLTYLVASVLTVWLLITSTPANLAAARSSFERLLAYWPLLIPMVAFLFQRVWKGNVVATFSTMYIEFIRGIPLITVMFLATVLFPLVQPAPTPGQPVTEIPTVWRVIWGFTLFAAAYLAENVRGGLQAIPNGQYEAADSLGFSTFDKYRLIILPQALRVVIPAIVGQFIGLFKDTTLVSIVGLLDLLGMANALSAQPEWLNVRREAYLFLAVLYFIGSALMAGYSRRLERRLGLGER